MQYNDRRRQLHNSSPGTRVDGADVLEVFRTAQKVVDAARGGRPGFLAVECYRFFGHARMDKSPYRTPDEETEGRKQDPLIRLRTKILDDGSASQAELDNIDAKVASEMDIALEFAIEAPPPALESMFRDVYAGGEVSPEPVRERIATILGK